MTAPPRPIPGAVLLATDEEHDVTIALIPILNEVGVLEWVENPAPNQMVARSKIQMMGPMLKDTRRNHAYREALHAAIVNHNNNERCDILDIGAGTGLLSLLALASSVSVHVVAVEMNPMLANITAQHLTLNGFQDDRAIVIAARSTDIPVSTTTRKADVVVTETLDSELLTEGIFGTLLDARQRFAHEKTIFIPCRASTWGILVCVVNETLKTIVARNTGQDMDYTPNGITVHGNTLIHVGHMVPVSAPFEIFTVIFGDEEQQSRMENVLAIPLTGRDDIIRPNAILTFWDCQLHSSTAPLSTNPLREDTNTFQDHWFNNLYPLDLTDDTSINGVVSLTSLVNLNTGKMKFIPSKQTSSTKRERLDVAYLPISIWDNNPFKYHAIETWISALANAIDATCTRQATMNLFDISDGTGLTMVKKLMQYRDKIYIVRCCSYTVLDVLYDDDDDHNLNIIDATAGIDAVRDACDKDVELIVVACNPASLLDSDVWELDSVLILLRRVQTLFPQPRNVFVLPESANIMCSLIRFEHLCDPCANLHVVEGFNHSAFSALVDGIQPAIRHSYVLENYHHRMVNEAKSIAKVNFNTRHVELESVQFVVNDDVVSSSSIGVVFWVSWTMHGCPTNHKPVGFQPVEVRFVPPPPGSDLLRTGIKITVQSCIGDKNNNNNHRGSFEFTIQVQA